MLIVLAMLIGIVLDVLACLALIAVGLDVLAA